MKTDAEQAKSMKEKSGERKMPKIYSITWTQDDEEDFVRIQRTIEGFNKFEIVGLLANEQQRTLLERAEDLNKILDENIKKYNRLNKLQEKKAMPK